MRARRRHFPRQLVQLRLVGATDSCEPSPPADSCDRIRPGSALIGLQIRSETALFQQPVGRRSAPLLLLVLPSVITPQPINQCPRKIRVTGTGTEARTGAKQSVEFLRPR